MHAQLESRSRTGSKKVRSGSPFVSPATLRSIVGVALLVAGAITLIGLFLPGGRLPQQHSSTISCGRSSDRVPGCLGVLLLVAGVLVERAP